MLTDLEIAQQAEILKITEIAKKVGLTEDDLELYNKYLKTTNVKGSLSIELERGM